MLDTIIVGVLVLAALAYGFWQYFARPANARDKRKNEAHYKKFDEYAPKDSKSTPTKKSSENSNQTVKSSNVKNSKRSNLKKRSDKANYSHNWLLTTLKGHTGSVMDMSLSANGKYLATCADDRTILIWHLKDLTNAKDRKTFRINVEYDHVYKLIWSPDSKAVLGFKAMENVIEAYRVEKKDGNFVSYAKSITFPCAHENDDDIISLDISCNGKFIISANNKTEIIIWDVRGNILERLDTFLMSNYAAKISPCARFVAASGFAPDVKLWEVKFVKGPGSYEKTVRAFELTGHKTGVWDFAFDHDGSHMATVCKDGTFKVFDTKIDYTRGESPCCILTGQYKTTSAPPLIALSSFAHVIAIAVGTSIHIFSGLTGDLDITIDSIFNDNIVAMKFDALGTQLFVAGDRQVRVFSNITGYKVGISVAKQKLKEKKISSAQQERLESQIEEFEAHIKKHE